MDDRDNDTRLNGTEMFEEGLVDLRKPKATFVQKDMEEAKIQ